MKEEPYYFENNGYQLFGILHRPEQDIAATGYVFCHPFAEEKLWTHRTYVNFARTLAEMGCPVLRFDFMGHGDSYGSFEESNVETNIADVIAAMQSLRSKTSSSLKICLVGLRYGAMIAATCAERVSDINGLILWDPVIDGERYMQEVLRTNLTTQMALHGKVIENREKLIENMRAGETVNVDGYEMSLSMFEQASAIKLKDNELRFAGDVLVMQIGKQGQPIKKDLKAFSDKYAKSEIRHAVEEPFWREIRRYYATAPNLYKETIEWINRQHE